MKKFNPNNSAAFINYLSHTNSSIAQSISFTSAKSDNESAINRNKTIYTVDSKTQSSGSGVVIKDADHFSNY